MKHGNQIKSFIHIFFSSFQVVETWVRIRMELHARPTTLAKHTVFEAPFASVHKEIDKLLADVRRIELEVGSDTHGHLLEPLSKLAEATALLGKFDDAITFQNRHLVISRNGVKDDAELSGSCAITVARSLNSLGIIHWTWKKNILQAEEYFKRALELIQNNRKNVPHSTIEVESEILSSYAAALIREAGGSRRHEAMKFHRRVLILNEALLLQSSERDSYKLDSVFVNEDEEDAKRMEQRSVRRAGLGTSHIQRKQSSDLSHSKNSPSRGNSKNQQPNTLNDISKSNDEESDSEVTELILSPSAISSLYNNDDEENWNSFIARRQQRTHDTSYVSTNHLNLNWGIWRADQLLQESIKRITERIPTLSR